MEQANASGIAVLYVHALNPYGFSHIRRVTQENVDLNRNFQDSARSCRPTRPTASFIRCCFRPLGRPHGATGPLSSVSSRRRDCAHSRPRFLVASTRGLRRHVFRRHLAHLEPSHAAATSARACRPSRQLAWIDLHTGLGKSGQCERIFMGRDGDVTGYARANAWWGKEAPLAQAGSPDSVSAPLTGLAWNAARPN